MTRIARTSREVRPRRSALIGTTALALLVFASVPAAVAAAPAGSATVVDRTLRVSGSPSPDQIALRLSSLDPNQLQVDFDDDGSAEFVFGLATFDAIDVLTGNGDDTVRVDDLNGAFTTARATRIDGGNGDDSLSGGSGAEVFIGGTGDDVVDGGPGADIGLVGRGDDVFIWNQGDGSDVVEGGRGSDTMVFNGFGANEVMAVTANAGRVRFTRVQGNIVMDLDDVEAIEVAPLGGTDAITMNDVRGTDLKRVDVDLAAVLGGSTPDGQADTVSAIGTAGVDSIKADVNGAAVEVSGLTAFVRITHADPALDRLAIDTLGGDDIVAVDAALDGLIQVSVQ